MVQHKAQIGAGFMAQGVRMPFVPMFIMQLPSMRMRLMQPSGGRNRLPSPAFNAMFSAVSNAVQMPPQRGPQQGRHEQGVQPNRQA